MTPAGVRCVVDASVVIKLFVAAPDSGRADALFAHLAASPPAQLAVPELIYAECANILWKYTQRFGMPAEEARQSLNQLLALDLDRVPLAEISVAALTVALARQVSVYDGCYLAASLHLQVPLVTADERLVNKLAGAGYDVQLLQQFPDAEPA